MILKFFRLQATLAAVLLALGGCAAAPVAGGGDAAQNAGKGVAILCLNNKEAWAHQLSSTALERVDAPAGNAAAATLGVVDSDSSWDSVLFIGELPQGRYRIDHFEGSKAGQNIMLGSRSARVPGEFEVVPGKAVDLGCPTLHLSRSGDALLGRGKRNSNRELINKFVPDSRELYENYGGDGWLDATGDTNYAEDFFVPDASRLAAPGSEFGDAATLYLFRDTQCCLSLMPVWINVDGEQRTSLGRKNYVRMRINAGLHEIRVEHSVLNNFPDIGIAVQLEAGKTYYIAYESHAVVQGNQSTNISSVRQLNKIDGEDRIMRYKMQDDDSPPTATAPEQ